MDILDRIKDGWSKRPVAMFMPCPITHADLNEETGNVELKIRCPRCNSINSLSVENNGLANWLFRGILIQNALPELNAIDRDLLTNGVCNNHE